MTEQSQSNVLGNFLKPTIFPTNIFDLQWNHRTTSLDEELDDISTSKRSSRSSEAVRKHVRKISEDFTITQTNFENASKPNSIIIELEQPILSPKLPRGLILSQPTCIKCNSCFKSKKKSSNKKELNHTNKCAMPLAEKERKCDDSQNNFFTKSAEKEELSSMPPTEPINDEIAHSEECSDGTRLLEKEILSLKQDSGKSLPCYKKHNSCSPNVRSESPRNPESGRWKSPSGKRLSMSAQSTPQQQRVNLEQLKRARQLTERAIKEKRVFSIYGYFPAVQNALKARGWVEKVLYQSPYVNPHPANCVCFQLHCPSSPLNSSAASSLKLGTNDASITDDITCKITSPAPRKPFNFIEHNKQMFKTKTNANNCSESIHEISENIGLSTDVKDIHQENIRLCSNTGDNCELIGKDVTEEERQLEDNLPNNDLQTSVENLDNTTENKNKARYAFNPSILCPEEIRTGIENCINENNKLLYSFSVPIYDKPDRKNANNVPAEDSQDENCSGEQEDNSVHDNEELVDVDNGTENNENSKLKEESKFIFNPLNPYPEYDFDIRQVDTSLVSRLLRNVEPNLLWTWNKESISYKHLTKSQIVNRFPNTLFTTKYGLCSSMRQLHWFSETDNADSFVPRGYCIGQAGERSAFVQDFRLTACLSMLTWVTESHDKGGIREISDTMGDVALRRFRQAVDQIERFIESCGHDNLDSPAVPSLPESEWDGVLTAHHRIIHKNRKIKATYSQAENLVATCRAALTRVQKYWPQLQMDGVRNVWIVKPGAQSRGRGIMLMDSLSGILSLVQSPFIYETKYVVQKYMERPFLIHNTKFDIRQWFLVTDWNPLTVWMYKSSYVRFCSQQYDLTRRDEAVHLSNNAIQCKYTNGERSPRLPRENMWDNQTFSAFLEEEGFKGAFSDIIYPGMKAALIATMLAAQIEIDNFKNGFELFGADFMLSEDLRPWLIEINSSPCMASSTSVTKRLCALCLEDIIKVVIDYKQNPDADTGDFELIHRDSQRVAPTPPYLGVHLQIIGKQIQRSGLLPEKCRKPLQKPKQISVVKPLRLVSLSMDGER